MSVSRLQVRELYTEQLIAEVRTLRGLIAQTGRYLNPSLKLGLTTAVSELASYRAGDFGARATSFQRRLQEAVKQGMTLREFEKRLV